MQRNIENLWEDDNRKGGLTIFNLCCPLTPTTASAGIRCKHKYSSRSSQNTSSDGLTCNSQLILATLNTYTFPSFELSISNTLHSTPPLLRLHSRAQFSACCLSRNMEM